MHLAPAGGVVEQHDGRVGATMTAIIGYDRPEIAALGGLSARVQHRRAGFIDTDAVRAAQMGTHVVDDWHQVETGPTDPVSERATIQIDPLTFEYLGLTVKRQMVAEFRDDGEPSRRHRFEPDGERR